MSNSLALRKTNVSSGVFPGISRSMTRQAVENLDEAETIHLSYVVERPLAMRDLGDGKAGQRAKAIATMVHENKAIARRHRIQDPCGFSQQISIISYQSNLTRGNFFSANG